MAINGHDINENWSKYSKPIYFDIAEVVKHDSQGCGRERDYGQIAKMAKKSGIFFHTDNFLFQ